MPKQGRPSTYEPEVVTEVDIKELRVLITELLGQGSNIQKSHFDVVKNANSAKLQRMKDGIGAQEYSGETIGLNPPACR